MQGTITHAIMWSAGSSVVVRRLFSSAASSAGPPKRVLVVGGCGAMGEAVLNAFQKKDWETYSLDIKHSEIANKSYSFDHVQAKADYSGSVKATVEAMEQDKVSFDAVVCAAGGWAGGDISSDDFPGSLELLWRLNIQSAATSSHLAAKFLSPGGMLTLTGAEVVRQGGTSFMPAYGMSKAATHHLVESASDGYLPDNCTVNAVLPVTIDTPINREGMPDADFTNWTDPKEIAFEIESWVHGSRPKNGAMVSIQTENGQTSFVHHQN